MAYVLVHFVAPPQCQSFDKYVQVPDDATQDEIDAAAEVTLLDEIRGGMTLQGGHGKDQCQPLDYTITYGPLLQ